MTHEKELAEKIIAVSGTELYEFLQGLAGKSHRVIIPRPIELSYSQLYEWLPEINEIEVDEWERRTLIGGIKAWVKIRRKDDER